MNFFSIITLFLIIPMGFGINSVHGQIDPFSDIVIFQTGKLHTENNQFLVSDKFSIREFSNGNIIRISGQTIEGFPFITYSKIIEDNLETIGKIFINGKFERLLLEQNIVKNETVEDKNDDIVILAQYSQRVYSKNTMYLDIKIFDKEKNPTNNYNQNQGYVSNVNIDVSVIDENNKQVFAINGTTNDNGFFETEYTIPDQTNRETLTVYINAENDISKSSKILQVFSLGHIAK